MSKIGSLSMKCWKEKQGKDRADWAQAYPVDRGARMFEGRIREGLLYINYLEATINCDN